MITYGSLFTGIGGIDLGLDRAGMMCLWQIENNPFCARLLKQRWPEVRRYGNIKSIDFTTIDRPNVLAGGFPCQPTSSAGKRLSVADPRWLWPEFACAIRDIRPDFAIIENVAGLLHRGLEHVLTDLATLGYDAEWEMLPACWIGAPHIRQRVWIVAYPTAWRRERQRHVPEGEAIVFSRGVAARSGAQNRGAHHWATEPDMVRMVHGFSNGVDGHRVMALGNAVVPQMSEYIARLVMSVV